MNLYIENYGTMEIFSYKKLIDIFNFNKHLSWDGYLEKPSLRSNIVRYEISSFNNEYNDPLTSYTTLEIESSIERTLKILEEIKK